MPKMNLLNLINTLKERDIQIFSVFDIEKLFNANYENVRKALYRYEKKGVIKKIKNGLYVFGNSNNFLLSNKIYIPSYISLEAALSYYNIIPETTYNITAITTKASREFEHSDLLFSYHKIKKEAFCGYRLNNGFLIADPEKALADLMYFKSLGQRGEIDRIDIEKIDKSKFNKYIKLFNSKTLNNYVKQRIY